jgi:hypothetical protein
MDMRTIAVFSAAAALGIPAFGQASSVQDVVAGKEAPLQLHLKELGADWKRMTISIQGAGGGMGDLMSQIMPMAMLGSSGPKGKDDMMGMALLSSMFGGGASSQPVYYTKGQTTGIGGETFLVAYKYEKPQMDFMQLVMESEKNGGKEPDFAKLMSAGKLTADSPLSLSLINVRTIASMGGIRAFDMAAEIAESAKGPGGLMEMFMSRAVPQEAPATAIEIPVPKAGTPKTPAKKPGTGK